MSSNKKVSLTDKGVFEAPYDYYKQMRENSPVHFDEGLNAWVVTRYEDVQQAARMTDELSNELGFDLVLRPEWQDDIDDLMRKEGHGPHVISRTVQVDPPLHARRRALINGAFNAKTVSDMESHIQGVARGAVDLFAARGEADLMTEYSRNIPILTICDLLNFPRDRIDQMSQWADSVVAQLSMGTTKEEGVVHARYVMELQNFVKEAIESRRSAPGDDLISTLIHAEIDDVESPRLTEEELLPMCLVLLAGGLDTTRNGISWAIYNLAKDPQLFSRLKNSDDQDRLLKCLIEETLRFESVVPQLPRYAKVECEVGGVTIPEGSSVFLCWGSANRDPDKFPNPDQFDIDRKNSGTHAAFGAGIHRCIGNMLARMEMKCALRELIQRMETLELTCAPEDVPLQASIVLRGPAKLPVRFTLS